MRVENELLFCELELYFTWITKDRKKNIAQIPENYNIKIQNSLILTCITEMFIAYQ